MACYIYFIKATRPDMLKTGLNEHERKAFEAHSAYLDELVKKFSSMIPTAEQETLKL